VRRRDQHGQAGVSRALAFRLLGDERLARFVEGGSDHAFAALYVRYAPVLHGYCRSIVLDEDDAGDALQSTMLKALEAMRRGARTGPVRPWLFRIARNESVTLLRRRRDGRTLEEGEPAPDGDPHRHAVARERLTELLGDLRALTAHQRGALVMRELGGLSYDEIGAALETSPLAARQAVFAARRALVARGRARRAPIRLLLPPAPAGAAILAAVLSAGGGAAGGAAAGAPLAAKVAMTLAAVGAGVGSVELATETPSPDVAKPAVVASASTPEATPQSAPKRAQRSAVVSEPKPAAASPARTRTRARETLVAEESPRPRRASRDEDTVDRAGEEEPPRDFADTHEEPEGRADAGGGAGPRTSDRADARLRPDVELVVGPRDTALVAEHRPEPAAQEACRDGHDRGVAEPDR